MRVVDNQQARADVLGLLDQDRTTWDGVAISIAMMCMNEKGHLDGIKVAALCAQAARGVVKDGETEGILARDEGGNVAFWHHECAARLLLAIIAEFLDDANGYFVKLLGPPLPHMHLDAKTNGSRRGKKWSNVAAEGEESGAEEDAEDKTGQNGPHRRLERKISRIADDVESEAIGGEYVRKNPSQKRA